MQTLIWQRYQALKTTDPHLRQRDAAAALDVSEAELVAALPHTRRLRPEFAELLRAFATLGEVKTITRNEHAVHEKVGRYDNLTLSERMGLALNPGALDLRFFFEHWASAFAVEDETPRGTLRSIQIYDRQGEAVHKVYLHDEQQLPAFRELLERFADTDVAPLAITPAEAAAHDDDKVIDVDAFRNEWLELKDVHHFHGLTRRYGVSRQLAFRLAPDGHAWRLDQDASATLLTRAAEQGPPIMVFVGNRGIVQIHTGPVERIKRVGEWINVLDPGFNLHLRDEAIAETWLVRRPSRDGIITAVEAFDAQGNSVLSFFGKRVEGEAELPAWRDLAESLPRQEVADAAA